MGALSPWHLLIFALIVLVLFGSTKLPGFARSVGRSMRIFKSEMKDFREGDEDEEVDQPSDAKPRSRQELPESSAKEQEPTHEGERASEKR